MVRLILLLVLIFNIGCNQQSTWYHNPTIKDTPDEVIYLDGCIDGLTSFIRPIMGKEYKDELERKLYTYCINKTIEHGVHD